MKCYTTVSIVICLLFPFKLSSSEPLRISLGDNYGKHAMVVDGKSTGIQKDILNWFFKEYMQLNVQLESMPWKRAQALVERTKKSDGYFTSYTKTRVEDLNLLVSKTPFYITHVKMHTWKGNPNLVALSQLKTRNDLLKIYQLRHVYLDGSGYHEEQFKDAKLVNRLNSIHQIAKFLLDYKRADIFVEQSELFYPIAEELGLKDKVKTLNNIHFKSLKWHLYIRKDSKHVELMKDINKALDRSIIEGTLLAKAQQVFAKYNLKYEE